MRLMQIRTKATSSSNSMHIRLPVLRYIQIYHQVDLVCIYTSGGLTSGKQAVRSVILLQQNVVRARLLEMEGTWQEMVSPGQWR